MNKMFLTIENLYIFNESFSQTIELFETQDYCGEEKPKILNKKEPFLILDFMPRLFKNSVNVKILQGEIMGWWIHPINPNNVIEFKPWKP